jgi:hypothetical protein
LYRLLFKNDFISFTSRTFSTVYFSVLLLLFMQYIENLVIVMYVLIHVNYHSLFSKLNFNYKNLFRIYVGNCMFFNNRQNGWIPAANFVTLKVQICCCRAVQATYVKNCFSLYVIKCSSHWSMKMQFSGLWRCVGYPEVGGNRFLYNFGTSPSTYVVSYFNFYIYHHANLKLHNETFLK